MPYMFLPLCNLIQLCEITPIYFYSQQSPFPFKQILISVNVIYGTYPAYFRNISRTFTEYLWNIYGIIIAMLDKIVNHFYTIFDNFNQRLTHCAIILYLGKKNCAIFHLVT